ncbi:MAG: type 4a pilus biogenesis protein PilO [Nitrospirota bacterium]
MKEVLKKIERYRIKLPIIILSVFIFLNLLFYFVFILPVKKETTVKNNQYQALRTGLNQKIQYKKTKSDISEFHKTLPDKRDFTKIINFISTGAKKNSLKMPAITYQQEKADDAKKDSKAINGYEKTTLLFSVQGRYEGIRRLIYEIESSGYLLIIEDMNLEKKDNKAADLVNLQIKVAAYTK